MGQPHDPEKDVEIQLLEERLRRQRIGFLGPSSETLSDLQLELLTEQEPGVTREEVETESQREPIVTGPPRAGQRKHPGPNPYFPSLSRLAQKEGIGLTLTVKALRLIRCLIDTRFQNSALSKVRTGPHDSALVVMMANSSPRSVDDEPLLGFACRAFL